MKNQFTTLFFIGIFLSITFYSCGQNIECKEGINLLPMYGKTQKCKQQLEADQFFLTESDKEEPDRNKAAINIMNNGWYYLHQGDYNTAMKRINQAWLLDSTNIAVYASFAIVLDLTEKTDDAIKMLDLTFDKLNTRLEPQHPTQINPSNETFIDFIVSNASFAYKKTHNPKITEYLYTKVAKLNIPDADKKILIEKLKTEMNHN